MPPWDIGTPAGLPVNSEPMVQVDYHPFRVTNTGLLPGRMGQITTAGNVNFIFTDGIADCTAVAFIERAGALTGDPVRVGIVHFQVLEWVGLTPVDVGTAIAGMTLVNTWAVMTFGTMLGGDGDFALVSGWLTGLGTGIPVGRQVEYKTNNMMVTSLAVSLPTGAFGRKQDPPAQQKCGCVIL